MSKDLHPVRVIIKNFQSIENLEFEVSGFTCITGKTNIGKSAIMRALSRALLNDPVTGMVRKGAKFSSVEMSSEGWGFLWEKGEKDVNRYQIDGKRFDKTGQTQLPEIEAMGFRSIKVGDDELEPWWATQTRPMFLLDKSGPQITNFISEVSRLKVYQDAIVLAARAKRKHTDDSKEKAEELGRVQDNLSKMTGLESVERLESEIEDQIRSLQEYVQKALTLDELRKSLERTAAKIRLTKDAAELRLKTDMEQVESTVAKFVKLARVKQRLDVSARRIIAIRAVDTVRTADLPEAEVAKLRALWRCRKIVPMRAFVEKAAAVQNVKDIGLDSLVTDVARTRQVWSLCAGIARRQRALDAIPEVPARVLLPEDELSKLRKIATAAARIQELRSSIAEADVEELRLSALKKKVDKKLAAAQVCPECGQKLPDEHSLGKKRRSLSV